MAAVWILSIALVAVSAFSTAQGQCVADTTTAGTTTSTTTAATTTTTAGTTTTTAAATTTTGAPQVTTTGTPAPGTAHQINFQNWCSQAVTIFSLAGTSGAMEVTRATVSAGGPTSFSLPLNWLGRIWGRYGGTNVADPYSFLGLTLDSYNPTWRVIDSYMIQLYGGQTVPLKIELIPNTYFRNVYDPASCMPVSPTNVTLSATCSSASVTQNSGYVITFCPSAAPTGAAQSTLTPSPTTSTSTAATTSGATTSATTTTSTTTKAPSTATTTTTTTTKAPSTATTTTTTTTKAPSTATTTTTTTTKAPSTATTTTTTKAPSTSTTSSTTTTTTATTTTATSGTTTSGPSYVPNPSAHQVFFKNNCNRPITLFSLENGAGKVATSVDMPVGSITSQLRPYQWAGRWFGRYDAVVPFMANVQGIKPDSLFEILFDGYEGLDFYDVSLVDGFSVPLSVAPIPATIDVNYMEPKSCVAVECLVDFISQCPPALRLTDPSNNNFTVACQSACTKFGSDPYCCTGPDSTSDTCPQNQYGQIFKNACPNAYSYAFDDPTSTFTCTSTTGLMSAYTVGFCGAPYMPPYIPPPTTTTPTPPPGSVHEVRFHSQCLQDVSVLWLANGLGQKVKAAPLANGATLSLNFPRAWSGRFWGRYYGKALSGNNPDSLFDITFDAPNPAWQFLDFYDIQLTGAPSIPLKVDVIPNTGSPNPVDPVSCMGLSASNTTRSATCGSLASPTQASGYIVTFCP